LNPARNGNRLTCETRLRVRYAETDQMGVVHHGNHFIWFEVGRVELLRQMGFSYRDMEQVDGCHIAVVDACCRYKAPAHHDDEIVVRTYLKRVRSSVLHFGYEIFKADDHALLALGSTTHVVIDKDMKVIPLPDKYIRVFEAAVVRDEF